MTLEKKNFRADARVLHEKASGGELRRKKKNVFFFEFFFRISKKGTAVGKARGRRIHLLAPFL